METHFEFLFLCAEPTESDVFEDYAQDMLVFALTMK